MFIKNRLEKVLSECADNTALAYDNYKISYRQIDEMSDYLVEIFKKNDICTGSTILILNDKSWHFFALMVACLKQRITYCNLDPTLSTARLQYITNLTNAEMVVNKINLETLISDGYYLNKKLVKKASRKSYNPYIMFTSGSTGNPKGVVIGEDGLSHFIDWGTQRFNVTSSDIITNINPIYFDNSIFDFYVSFFNGATLLPIMKDQLDDPRLLSKSMILHRPTIWFSVPTAIRYLSTFRVFNFQTFPNLKYIIFGGEPFPKKDLRKIYNEFKSYGTKLINVYGPTECTCICSSHTVTAQDFVKMDEYCPIGVINSGFYYSIEDLDGNLVARGKKGELVLGGQGVGAGYVNEKKMTNASFVQNSSHDEFIDIVYRTGDLVSEVEGKIQIHGRNDNQVKIAGHRIELEEIENMALSISVIRECMAFVAPGQFDLDLLILIIVLENEGLESEIFSALKAILPNYMVPKKIIYTNKLIKNRAGKLDRKKNIAEVLEKPS
jgi:D-alanine--poly(phosphoribitol) ligase subunit 1